MNPLARLPTRVKTSPVSSSPQTIVVIGSGSLAVGLSYYLKSVGFAPRILSRDGAIDMVGYRLKTPEGGWTVDLPAAGAIEIGQADVAFVCVKSYQLKQALSQHLSRLKDGCAVIPVGNGAIDDDLKSAAAEFPKLAWRLGTTTIAVSEEEPGKLALKNPNPRLFWGPFFGQAAEPNETEKALIQSKPNLFIWTNDVQLAYRKKWLFNTVLNSLCGALNLKENGEALDHRQALMRAFAEAYSLAETHWEPWPEGISAQKLFAELLTLINSTYENENSMRKDLRMKRPTETAVLAGVARKYDEFPFLSELDGVIRGEIERVEIPETEVEDDDENEDEEKN